MFKTFKLVILILKNGIISILHMHYLNCKYEEPNDGILIQRMLFVYYLLSNIVP